MSYKDNSSIQILILMMTIEWQWAWRMVSQCSVLIFSFVDVFYVMPAMCSEWNIAQSNHTLTTLLEWWKEKKKKEKCTIYKYEIVIEAVTI